MSGDILFDFYGALERNDRDLKAVDLVVAARYLLGGVVWHANDRHTAIYERGASEGDKRRVVLVVVDFDRKLPLVHAGMRLSGRLRRGRALPTSLGQVHSFNEYEYEVVFVRSCSQVEFSRGIYEKLLCTEQTWRVLDESRTAIGRQQRRNGRDELARSRLSLLPTLVRAPMPPGSFATLVSLAQGSVALKPVVLNHLGNRYASARGSLVLVPHGDVVALAHHLGLDGARCERAPLADLVSIATFVDQFTPATVTVDALFFGARVPLLIEGSASTALAGSPGARFSIQALRAKELLNEYVPNALARATPEKSEEEEEEEIEEEEESGEEEEQEEAEEEGGSKSPSGPVVVLTLAHEMYRAAFFLQRAGYGQGVFSVRKIAQKATEERPTTPLRLNAAVDFLFAARVWVDLGDGLAASWRDYCHASAIIRAVDSSSRRGAALINCGGLVPSNFYANSTEMWRALCRRSLLPSPVVVSRVLWVVAACTPARADTALPLASLVSYESLFGHNNHDDNAARYALEIAAGYDAVVLCDAHVLSSAQLVGALQFFDEMQRGIRLLLSGDVAARGGETTFSELFASGRLATHSVVDELSAVKLGDTVWLRQAVSLAANSATWRERLVQQLLEAPLEVDVCALPHAPQLIERFHSLADSIGKRRYIVVAQTGLELLFLTTLVREFDELAPTTTSRHVATLGEQFSAMMPCAERALESTVLFVAPFVGIDGARCVRVSDAWRLDTLPDDRTASIDVRLAVRITIDPCNATNAAFSLNDPLLFVRLDEVGGNAVDHRVCCRSWSPTVMHVARHRNQLCSQSFPMARRALPLVCEDEVETVLCFVEHPTSFCYDDFYDALLTATPLPGPLALAMLDRARFAAQLGTRRTRTQTLLSRLLKNR